MEFEQKWTFVAPAMSEEQRQLSRMDTKYTTAAQKTREQELTAQFSSFILKFM